MNFYIIWRFKQAMSRSHEGATCREPFDSDPRLAASSRAGSDGGACSQEGAGSSCTMAPRILSGSICLRANYSYDPAKDSELPCTRAGLTFNTGDILIVKDKEDVNWWKACLECEPMVVGLIPSPALQKFRASCATRPPLNKGYSFFGRKKKQSKAKKSVVVSKADDKPPYEEVIKLKSFEWRTLVLLGAHGVGRRHIKKSLLISQPDKFAYPVPHTTRDKREDEINGHQYYFVSHEEMMKGIKENDFLEYGQHEDAMYGTRLDTIRRIHQQGKMAILDVECDALQVLRCAEFAPYVVFIEAPKLVGVSEMDKSLENLIRDSENIRRNYEYTFNLRLVNSDIERTILTLREHLKNLDSLPHWVPVNWT